MIPMVDLTTQYRHLKNEIDTAILNVLASGQFILGPEVEQLEKEISEYLDIPYAISVASGTDALHLALHACNIRAGDEIITTPFSFIATGEAICYLGAQPVFVDIELDTFNIDVTKIEQAITPKTKAILPVHLFGLPANMPAIVELAQHYGLKIIEDCAQSFGAHLHNKSTGTWGNVGCFSFFPSKNLGAYGDGGLIITRDPEIAKRLLQLRNHGSTQRYYHDIIGYNSRLDEIQAAILRVKLRHLNKFNQQRREIASHYTRLLADSVKTPTEYPGSYHIYHQYTILSDQRDQIRATLAEQEIASAIYYPVPLHQQKVFGDKYRYYQLPNCEYAAQRCLSIPIYPELTLSQTEQIATLVKHALSEYTAYEK